MKRIKRIWNDFKYWAINRKSPKCFKNGFLDIEQLD